VIRFLAIAFAVIAIATAPFADAAPRKKSKAKVVKPSPEPIPLEIELPGRVAEETIAIIHPHEKRESALVLDLAVTTWIPEDLQLDARSADVSRFAKSFWPGVELGLRTRPFARPLGISLNGALSVGFQHFTRNANFVSKGYSYADRQNLFLIPVAMGLETSLSRWEGRNFVPSIAFSIVPTFGMLSSSSISSSDSPMAWAYEARFSLSGRLGAVEDGRWVAFVSGTWNTSSEPLMNLKGVGAGAGILF
jgi:hypothetical protein